MLVLTSGAEYLDIYTQKKDSECIPHISHKINPKQTVDPNLNPKLDYNTGGNIDDFGYVVTIA